jgi:RNA polymerase sigma-70 factor (ECF subfamily)
MQSGERRAYEEFVDLFGPRVHRLVKRHVQNPSDVDDVTQEIFIDIYRCIANFRGDSALMTWVYRIAVNHCLRHEQQRRADSAPYDENALNALPDWRPGPAEAAARSELKAQVRGSLITLTQDHRTVVILHELHGLTYTECAELLSIPVGTVKSRLSNAFKRMRVNLSEYVLGDAPAGQAASEIIV